MGAETLIHQLEANIHRLGDSKKALEEQLAKSKEEMRAMYTINKELQTQIDDLNEQLRLRELQPTVKREPEQEEFHVQTQQRIKG